MYNLCSYELHVFLTKSTGKSGHVAQRFASSLSSIGVPANFVHAAEWIHGDLGAVLISLCMCIHVHASTSQCTLFIVTVVHSIAYRLASTVLYTSINL